MTEKTPDPCGSDSSNQFGPSAWWHRVKNGNIRCWTSTHAESLRLAKEVGVELEPLYDAATVRLMLEGAWLAGYYDAGYTNDSAYACKTADACADGFLLPKRRRDGKQSGMEQKAVEAERARQPVAGARPLSVPRVFRRPCAARREV